MSDRMPCGCTVTYTTQFGAQIGYCWRHDENHALAAERRRYALLQAATVIMTSETFHVEVTKAGLVDGKNTPEKVAIAEAETLLADIEKREAGK